MKYIFLMIIFSLFTPDITKASPVTNNDLKEITKDFDYQKTKKIRVPDVKAKSHKTKPKTSTSSGDFGHFLKTLFEWIIYFFVGMLVILLFYFIIKNTNFKTSETKSDVILPTFDDDSKSENPDELLATALEANNYQLIIRIRFVQILNALHEQKFIKKAVGKTNRMYLNELKGPLKKSFFEMVRIFEKSWYDNKEVTKEQYLATEKLYHQMLTGIHES